MWYLTLAQLMLTLINAARDGKITGDEVVEAVGDLFPEYLADIVTAVDEALEDGRIDLDDLIKIVIEIVS